MDKWIRVEDELPEMGGKRSIYIANVETGIVKEVLVVLKGTFFWEVGKGKPWGIIGKITHWQYCIPPLPPKGEK